MHKLIRGEAEVLREMLIRYPRGIKKSATVNTWYAAAAVMIVLEENVRDRASRV